MGSLRIAALLALVAALTLAGSAAAVRMDVTHGAQPAAADTDGVTTSDATTTTETTPGPDVCPSTAVSPDPNPACPDEQSVSDDQGNPVPCNYYSGTPSEPCPHADADWWIAKCADGQIVHVSRDAPDGTIEDSCPDGYVVLDP